MLLDSPLAVRPPKTDRLVLARFLKDASEDRRLNEDEIAAAHAVLVKWADLESSGRLAEFNETQMQGDFLAQVFGEALGYAGPLDGAEAWHREQHHAIAGETPDAVLGFFRPAGEPRPLAVVELKGPLVDLDRHRSNGRTAVAQCWDYLVNTPPACRWGIVSNIISFRLYERGSTKRAYEHFTLQSLRNLAVFKQFYVLFHRQGLIEKWIGGPPRALALLERSAARQREVTDTLYDGYSRTRTDLIAELHFKQGHPLEASIEMAQRLFDRIIFVAFCEDRRLLPEATIPKAYSVAGFHAVTNPRWQNFKNLFRFIDAGNAEHGIPRYNGGLFAPHRVDEIELADDPWTTFFKGLSQYDFADEVNLDVLGHLFERSITELERLKQSGIFGDAEKASAYAAMPQSAKRKQLGIYYTPRELTGLIVQFTVDELLAHRFAAAAEEFGVSAAEAARGVLPDDAAYWRRCLEILRSLKVLDPACGSGAFLFQAYDALEARYNETIGHLIELGEKGAKVLAGRVAEFILQENLYGVDLSPEAVEITQLALWIRSATPGQLLASLSENIVHGNSLVDDPALDPAAVDWQNRFPAAFDRPERGFDCVIGNPPWERIKLQEREFFSLPAPAVATATDAAKRRRLVAELAKTDPPLFARYQQALAAADALLTHCRTSGRYPLTGKGDVNLYSVFAELASRLVAPHGRVGMLVPSGIASDMTTKDFFASVAQSGRLVRLYDFENRLKIFFPEVDGRFKFSILNFGGAAAEACEADYFFFAHRVEDLDDAKRHIALGSKDICLLNPNTQTCPIFRTRRDAQITKAIYRRVPVLFDRTRKGPTDNPWGVAFRRMFDQTNDAELFREADALKAEGYRPSGNYWKKGKSVYVPLYEAKMLQAYDHRAGDVVTAKSNWVRQGQTEKRSLVGYQNPEQLALPRYWVAAAAAAARRPDGATHLLCYKDVTSPTNQRTMIAAMMPPVGAVNSAPIVRTAASARQECCLLANLNSFVYDFVARQKVGNVHLNFFIVEQVPTLPPATYSQPRPGRARGSLEDWVAERVLKLVCTAEDMLPLADACGFTGGSFKEYGGRLNRWDPDERLELTAELDALFAQLYGLDEDDFGYVLESFPAIPEKLKTACLAAFAKGR